MRVWTVILELHVYMFIVHETKLKMCQGRSYKGMYLHLYKRKKIQFETSSSMSRIHYIIYMHGVESCIMTAPGVIYGMFTLYFLKSLCLILETLYCMLSIPWGLVPWSWPRPVPSRPGPLCIVEKREFETFECTVDRRENIIKHAYPAYWSVVKMSVDLESNDLHCA